VERRRGQAAPPVGEDRADTEAGSGAEQAVPGPAAAPPLKSWEQMRDWAEHLLRSRAGQDVAAWNRRAAEPACLTSRRSGRGWMARM